MAGKKKNISRIFEQKTAILRAVERGALDAIRAHERAGIPVVIYRAGRTVLVPAGEILKRRPKR